MRWERLFDDLEGEIEAERRRALDGEVAERSRYEFGLLTLSDRLSGVVGGSVRALMLGGASAEGAIRAVGRDWLLLSEGPVPCETLVAIPQIVSVTGVERRSAPETGDETDGLSEHLLLRHLIRGLGRDRSPVAVHTTDASTHCGTFDRVGRDHAELAIHPIDMARRPGSVLEMRIVLLASIAVVRTPKS